MDAIALTVAIGPALAGALAAKGYTDLTPVQMAVLDPDLHGRDLRISSQTGSGKTVAIGLALRDCLDKPSAGVPGIARPRALIIAPTRELARQVEEELTWLYAPLHTRVASATGGASYRTERRALGSTPAVVVGTPGRLIDHLGRGVIDLADLKAVVLDEADRMLEMGFREELEAILGYAPEQHRTHLVSATFPPEVKSLADRVQNNPAHVEGTRLGEANADIEHLVHLIDPEQRVDAIVNLLLANPDEQMLVFARTRADVADIAEQLEDAGFAVGALSGELEQAARDRALGAFRRGDVRALVATDVAARGIDVSTIARVVHADPPGDANGYTHRSGRTGRAGRKGTSSVLVPLSAFRKTHYVLRSAGVEFQLQPIPTAEEIEAAADARLLEQLTEPEPEGFKGYDDRTWQMAKLLAASEEVTRILARMLQRMTRSGAPLPRSIRVIRPPTDRKAPAGRGAGAGPRPDAIGWVQFRVSWGKVHGADSRRLLAVVCRRGGIKGSDVGSIRIGPTSAIVEVRADLAESFARSAARPDPRDPKIHIGLDRAQGGARRTAPSTAPESLGPDRSKRSKRAAPSNSTPPPKPRKRSGGDSPPRRRKDK